MAINNGLNVDGKDPCGYGASALYIASKQCGLKVIQKEISDIAKITEVTLRYRYKEIKGFLRGLL